jgi:hypothetical protein
MSLSLASASMAPAYVARVIVNDVLLPDCGEENGNPKRVSPRTMMQLSQLTFSTSAATRDVEAYENVPKLPTPQWMCSLPSGVIRTMPSRPPLPAE